MKQKRNYLDVLRKFQYPLLIASASVPVVLIFFAYYATELLNLAWVIPAGYTVISILCLLIRGKWRLAVGLIGTLVILAAGRWFMLEAAQIFMLVMAVAYGITLLSGLADCGVVPGGGDSVVLAWGRRCHPCDCPAYCSDQPYQRRSNTGASCSMDAAGISAVRCADYAVHESMEPGGSLYEASESSGHDAAEACYFNIVSFFGGVVRSADTSHCGGVGGSLELDCDYDQAVY